MQKQIMTESNIFFESILSVYASCLINRIVAIFQNFMKNFYAY
jgi:hypothetical protein